MPGCNFNDAASRAAFMERVGHDAYDAAPKAHMDASVIETLNGHGIRPVGTRFGRLLAVGSTGSAFRTIGEAHELTGKAHAARPAA